MECKFVFIFSPLPENRKLRHTALTWVGFNMKTENYSLEQNFDFYLECMRETFIASYRSILDFENFAGPNGEKYYQRLSKWISSGNAYLVHLRQGQNLIGICEATVKTSENFGMIHTIFVKESFRGQGCAQSLEEGALDFMKSRGKKVAILNVARKNQRAIQFYGRTGWASSEKSPYPDAIQMEKLL